MTHQRSFDPRGVDVLERRIPVPRHEGVGFRHIAGGQECEGAAHAEPGDADLGASGRLQILHCTADVLSRRRAEVESLHQVLRFLLFERFLAAVEIRDQSTVSGRREVVRNAANLVVESPPLLNHDDAGLGTVRIAGQVAIDVGAIRTVVGDQVAHRGSPRAGARMLTGGGRPAQPQ